MQELVFLEFVEGSNVHGLAVVFKRADLLLESFSAHLVVLDDASDLQLLDTVGDWDQLGLSPHESFHLNATHGRFKGRHVGLVVPRLAIKQHT